MRTSEELRETLFKTIEDLREGKIKAAEGNAIVNCAHQIIQSVKVEIEVAVNRDAFPAAASALPPPLMLTETA